MPKVGGRPRATGSALIAAVLLVGLVGPATTEAAAPPNIERFMTALGAVESHGNYAAVNATSGAIGKYQILPANWRAWARRYLGDPDAPTTPANQDYVARKKLTALYRWLGAWAPVAHWWLTGDGGLNPNYWSDYSRRYVNRILVLIGEPLLPPRPPGWWTQLEPPTQGRVYDDTSVVIAFSDGWAEAELARYNGGRVHYATQAGVTAAFNFTGTAITLVGPIGPTRGQARIYIDDALAGTVNAHASHFRPRVELFSRTFDRRATHTIRVEVVGTRGHAMVAIDTFVVDGWRHPLSGNGAGGPEPL